MHTTPEGSSQSRIEEGICTQDLPDITGMEWLVDLWRGAGMATRGTPLPWCEIQSFCWAENLPKPIARLIRSLSVAYCKGLSLTDPLSIAPVEMKESASLMKPIEDDRFD